MENQKKKSSKAGRNASPSRAAYWRENRLRKHKVCNMVRCNGLTRAEAERQWDRTRHTRCFVHKIEGLKER